jgi:hypothetical protein
MASDIGQQPWDFAGIHESPHGVFVTLTALPGEL